jgi:hypothetical protein
MMMGEVKTFRLMLSDTLVDGGQRVKTFNLSRGEVDLMTMNSLLDRCRDHFGFDDLLKQRFGREQKAGGATTAGPFTDCWSRVNTLLNAGSLSIMGIDGSRHAHIRSDEQLVGFFKNVRQSKLPSLEVKLMPIVQTQPVPARSLPVALGRKGEKDRVEELEDINMRMSKATRKVELALDAAMRQAAHDKDELQRQITILNTDISTKMEAEFKLVREDVKKLFKADESQISEVTDVRKLIIAVEKRANDLHNNVLGQMESMANDTNAKFQEVEAEFEKLRLMDQQLQTEDARQQQQLSAHENEMKRIDKAKVEKKDWEASCLELNTKIDEGVASLHKKIDIVDKDLSERLVTQRKELEAADEALGTKLQSTSDDLNDKVRKLDQELHSTLTKLTDLCNGTRADLEAKLATDVGALSTSVDKRFNDLTSNSKSNDKEMKQSVATLDAKADATFQKLFDRLDNVVKAERARLGTIERDLVELTAKLRSDCRAEVERVRVDYEQEAARLDGDLGDLHMKHDVVKQEINFFQSRLLEQRDWAQRQLAEIATATRAAQVDAQEGVAACTKMSHVLRDDQVTFRDKMGKHISLLQHASDSYGDAINTLETQRVRMRMELDAVLDDHKEYVTDMDGWADDVRVKVERLFRAMEPPRCEWRIPHAKHVLKDMKKPLSLTSSNFTLQGLKECQMQLYPCGTNQSPEVKVVLRLIMPPNAQVRYQVWLGKLTDGFREFKGGGSLYIDVLFDSWRDQISEDGSLKVAIEVLEDMVNQDASLARSVQLQYEPTK